MLVDLLQNLVVLILSEVLHPLQVLLSLLIRQLDLLDLTHVNVSLGYSEGDLRVLCFLAREESIDVDRWERIWVRDGLFEAVVDHWIKVPILATCQGFILSRDHLALRLANAREGIVERIGCCNGGIVVGGLLRMLGCSCVELKSSL